MINFKGSQFEKEIILWGVRWYVAYPISYRQLEEMMGSRGWQWIIPRLIAGSSSTRRRLRSNSVAGSVPWDAAGAWMKRT